jgi:hypothetical protein
MSKSNARHGPPGNEALRRSEDRRQGVLIPEFLDDWVAEENPVRVIDVFADASGSGLQDHRRLQEGQRPGYPGDVPAVH